MEPLNYVNYQLIFTVCQCAGIKETEMFLNPERGRLIYAAHLGIKAIQHAIHQWLFKLSRGLRTPEPQARLSGHICMLMRA